MSLALLLAALALVVWISRNISRSLSSLAGEAENIREFRFDTPITVRSRIREVDDLAETMGLMKSSLQQFLDISQALSAEKDIGRVLEMVLNEAVKVSQADGGAILMMGEDHRCLEVALLSGCARSDAAEHAPIELRASPAEDGPDSVDRHTARQGVFRVQSRGGASGTSILSAAGEDSETNVIGSSSGTTTARAGPSKSKSPRVRTSVTIYGSTSSSWTTRSRTNGIWATKQPTWTSSPISMNDRPGSTFCVPPITSPTTSIPSSSPRPTRPSTRRTSSCSPSGASSPPSAPSRSPISAAPPIWARSRRRATRCFSSLPGSSDLWRLLGSPSPTGSSR